MNYEDEHYNTEISLLDGLYAFHPEAFGRLPRGDLAALQQYYLIGEATPKDVFAHRAQIADRHPEVVARAQLALEHVCKLFDIAEISY